MLFKFILFSVQFFGLVIVVICEATSPSSTGVSALDQDIANITISPTVRVTYTVEVTTSGPAVLDSIMVFMACVYIEPRHTLPTERLRFQWLNTADHSEDYTNGSHVSELHKTFSHDMVVSGDFLMTVVVSADENPSMILTFSSIIFRLTTVLNGNLKVKQDLDYQRVNTTFAIDRPVYFHLNITDRFRESQTPKFLYLWYNGSDLIHMTFSPSLEQNFSQPYILHLQAIANAVFPLPSIPTPAPPHIPYKNGSFTEKLHFKESLSKCNFSRMESSAQDQSVKLGQPLVLNVTCSGSFPSAVCWNITQQNLKLNNTCKPASGQFTNSTQHNVSVSINSTGWHTVHLAVYNDVSFQVLSRDYYVYDAASVNIPALVFPIVFIMLGGVLVVLGATYIVRLRHKAHVEVADFDFDPTISLRSTGSLSRLVLAIKHFIRFRRCSSSTPIISYSTGRRFHSMYESL